MEHGAGPTIAAMQAPHGMSACCSINAAQRGSTGIRPSIGCLGHTQIRHIYGNVQQESVPVPQARTG